MDFTKARYSIAGLFDDDNALFDVLDTYPLVKSVYGCPSVDWNGGHPQPIKNHSYDYDQAVKRYNDSGISCLLTLTNKNPRLDDKMSYEILRSLRDDPINGVTLSSLELFDFIKKDSPNLRTKSSLTALDPDPQKRIKQYKEFLSIFDCVVIHPDDNRVITKSEYDFMDRNRIEVLINEGCAQGCQFRTFHFGIMSGELTQESRERADTFARKFCPNDRGYKGERTSLSLSEVIHLYNSGITNFKIQSGRSMIKSINFLRYYYLNENIIHKSHESMQFDMHTLLS